MQQPILQMKNITKRFPGILANDNVNVSLYKGEIHALLGENGAGKSTLMNILTGIYYPTSGELFVNGQQVEMHSTKTATELGIGMVHQHFMLVDSLTVAENILLPSDRCPSWLNRKKMELEVERFSRSINLPVNPSAKVWQLSIGEQQRVEIVKLLFSGTEILILDEPTAVLTPGESKDLFIALRKLAEEGKTILFITHKMNEVMDNADRITVLRSGKSIATMLKKDTTREELMKLMVGHELPTAVSKAQANDTQKEEVLLIDDVSADTDQGFAGLKNISLKALGGEILGIAGVSGNGQKELAEVITGLRKATSGKITFYKKDITNHDPKSCLEEGIAYIPEDRIGVGLVSSMNMFENTILRQSDAEPFSKNGLLNYEAIKNKTESIASGYDIKNAGLGKPVSLMSGGNIQKLLIARELDKQPKLLVAAYPVHGLDIGATQTIHNILISQRNNGAAVILFSEDLDELFEMSDRIAVLYDGKIAGTDYVGNLTYETVGEMMLGSWTDEGNKDE